MGNYTGKNVQGFVKHVVTVSSIRNKRPELFKSIAVFHRVMYVFECHSFGLGVMRFVINMFDKDVMRHIVLEETSDDDEVESQPMTAKPFKPS